MSLRPTLEMVVDTSLGASVALILLMCGRSWLRKFAGNRLLPWLWLIVAVRLLLPWPVPSRWRVLPADWPKTGVQVSRRTVQRPAVGVSGSLAVTADGSRPEPKEAGAVSSETIAAAPAEKSMLGLGLWKLLYLLGISAALANLAWQWWRTRAWAFRASVGVTDPGLAAVFVAIPEQWRRGVVLRITDAVEVPSVSGIWRPQIWIPGACLERLDPEGLRHVLLHELGHVRRRDLLGEWIWALAGCVHWFNPLVWVGGRMARADRELACDAWVLAHGTVDDLGGDFPADYGNTLIKIVEGLRRPPARRQSPAVVAMATSQRNLGLRVREIGAFRRVSPWRGYAAALAMAVLVAAFTADQRAPGQEKSATTPVAASSTGAELPSPAAGEATPPAGSTLATKPGNEAALPASDRQIHIEAKIVALAKSTVKQLAGQKAQFPGAGELIDELNDVMTQKEGNAGAPGSFSISQVIAAGVDQAFSRALDQRPGVELLSAPRVTVESEQQATIEIIQEFLYPTKFTHTDLKAMGTAVTPVQFGKKNTGLTIEVMGSVAPAQDAIDFTVNWQLAEVQGWVSKEGKPVPADKAAGTIGQPVFATQTVETCVTMPPGATLVLASPPRAPGTLHALIYTGDLTFKEDYVILNFITVTLLKRPSATSVTDELTEVLERKLESIIIPEIAFNSVTVPDAIEFLRQEVQRLDPNPDAGNRGVNIFLKLPVGRSGGQTGAGISPGRETIANPAATPASTITLKMQRVPSLDVLRAIASQAGMKVEIEPYAAAIVPLAEVTEKLVTAQFAASAEELGAPSGAVPTGGDAGSKPIRFDAKVWLIAKGLTFPPGSSATYLANSKRLVLRDTQENVDRLKGVLALVKKE